MKERYIKEKLRAYTVAPADEMVVQKTILAGKQILAHDPAQELCWHRRIVNQMKYISPAFWGGQIVALVLCMILVSHIRNMDLTSVLSVMSFLLVLLGVAGFPEVCKSFSHEMWELEQSCKYNLRQIVAIRLFTIGTIDLVIVLAVTAITSVQTKLPMWEMAIYLFLPFNLACIMSFFIASLARNKKIRIPTFPAGFALAFAMFLCINRFSLYQSIPVPMWSFICLGSFGMLFVKAIQFIRDMDEGGLALCN